MYLPVWSLQRVPIIEGSARCPLQFLQNMKRAVTAYKLSTHTRCYLLIRTHWYGLHLYLSALSLHVQIYALGLDLYPASVS
jgi:hypothetical protein